MKVLLVDDTEMIIRMYSRALTEAGYEVIAALDGQAAFDQAKQELPDLVLLDVMMPVVNGMEALGLLKNDEVTQSIPVIMLSAGNDATLMGQAMQAGAKRYLIKSMLEPSEVVGIVGTVIEESKN